MTNQKMQSSAPHQTKVCVGNSVYEDAVVAVREGRVYIEFEADDLDDLSFDAPMAGEQ